MIYSLTWQAPLLTKPAGFHRTWSHYRYNYHPPSLIRSSLPLNKPLHWQAHREVWSRYSQSQVPSSSSTFLPQSNSSLASLTWGGSAKFSNRKSKSCLVVVVSSRGASENKKSSSASPKSILPLARFILDYLAQGCGAVSPNGSFHRIGYLIKLPSNLTWNEFFIERIIC